MQMFTLNQKCLNIVYALMLLPQYLAFLASAMEIDCELCATIASHIARNGTEKKI